MNRFEKLVRGARYRWLILIVACGIGLGSRAPVFAVAATPGDYNADGLVSHADYSLWAALAGDPAGFDTYKANYGVNGPSAPTSAGPLSVLITSSPTSGGNVQWTIAFTNVFEHLAGHLSIRVDGPSAPNILSITRGTSFQDVPGDRTFSWETLTNIGTSGDCNSGSTGNCPVGAQYNNAAHEAYAALGTSSGAVLGPTNPTPTFVTLVTAGQSPTTIRVLGSTPLSSSPSKYGYKTGSSSSNDFAFGADIVGTFVPEPSGVTLVLLAMSAGHLVIGRRGRRSA